jgi:hypothetical protein
LFTKGEHIEKVSKIRSDSAVESGASHDGASSGARMNKTDLGQLAMLIRQKHDELLAHWRGEVRLLAIAETFRPLTITFPTYWRNWLASWKRLAMRRSLKRI